MAQQARYTTVRFPASTTVAQIKQMAERAGFRIRCSDDGALVFLPSESASAPRQPRAPQ